MRPADAPRLAAYRNLPDVARYQGWSLPYRLDQAEEMLRALDRLDDVTPHQWVQIAVVRDGYVIGDVAVHLTGTDIATIGYTLDPAFQGTGFASEAVGALVAGLFARVGVHRVEADTDPQNLASMRVVEPLGFEYEGTSRAVTSVQGEWVDECRFGLLRADHEAWNARPTARPDGVGLVGVTNANVRAVQALRTFRYQEAYVAPVSESLAQALVPPTRNGSVVRPWFRAAVADGEVVGFVMTAEPSDAQPCPHLWRLLVDRRHQRRGIGALIVERLTERFRAEGHRELTVNWTPSGVGAPGQFYERLGFAAEGIDPVTGQMNGRLVL